MEEKTARVIVNVWLTISETSRKLSISDDSVIRRAIPFQPDPVPGKIRWKMLTLDPGKPEGRRFLDQDAEAMLQNPAKLEQPGRRKLFQRKQN